MVPKAVARQHPFPRPCPKLLESARGQARALSARATGVSADSLLAEGSPSPFLPSHSCQSRPRTQICFTDIGRLISALPRGVQESGVQLQPV